MTHINPTSKFPFQALIQLKSGDRPHLDIKLRLYKVEMACNRDKLLYNARHDDTRSLNLPSTNTIIILISWTENSTKTYPMAAMNSKKSTFPMFVTCLLKPSFSTTKSGPQPTWKEVHSGLSSWRSSASTCSHKPQSDARCRPMSSWTS